MTTQNRHSPTQKKTQTRKHESKVKFTLKSRSNHESQGQDHMKVKFTWKSGQNKLRVKVKVLEVTEMSRVTFVYEHRSSKWRDS